MTLPLPRLDDRTFADLVDEARSLIPTYAPGWTNYNASDPGITLIELFAWLAEQLVYRADQVPDAHRLVFLRLLNGPAWQPVEGRTVDDEIEATLAALRSPYRTVTAADYEALAVDADPRVARALAVPRRDLSARDEAGRLADRPGTVSILVLPVAGTSAGDAAALRDLVAADLEPRRLLTVRNVIAEPVWAPVSAEVVVAPRDDVPVEQARDAVVAAVERLLDPHAGGRAGTGWPFGRDVYVSDLYAEIERLPVVQDVADVRLGSTCPAGETRCAAAAELWDAEGEQVGLRLAPHHLPRAAIEPASVVVCALLVPVRATIAVALAPGVGAADARRAAKDGLRTLFHPLREGATGGRSWRLGSDEALRRLNEILRGRATVRSVSFAGDAEHVSTDDRDVVTVWLGAREVADLHPTVVIA